MKIIFSLIALALLIPGVAFAYEIEYETFGPQFDGIPLVCVLEVDGIAPTLQTILMKETKNAIIDWESQLKNAERHGEGKEKWEIKYIVIPIEDQEDYDYQACDVIIEFLSQRPGSLIDYHPGAETAYAEDEFGTYSIINVYYSKLDYCKTGEDAERIYYKLCYTNDILTPKQLANSLKHEFGHALGLGHYPSNDEDVNLEWASGRTIPPSMMIVFDHDKAEEERIKTIDIEKVREMYGPEGFLQNFSFELPSWIKQNANWWSLGAIGDEDFIQGIQYLVQQNIIQIPDTKSQSMGGNSEIPQWIKSNAQWWSQDLISDEDFVKGIQYLVEKGIIQI